MSFEPGKRERSVKVKRNACNVKGRRNGCSVQGRGSGYSVKGRGNVKAKGNACKDELKHKEGTLSQTELLEWHCFLVTGQRKGIKVMGLWLRDFPTIQRNSWDPQHE